MKIILILFVILVVALGGAYYVGYDIGFEKAVKQTEPKIQKEENIQASFVIFTNGILRDFSDVKYHNRSKDVYITSENPTEVIVKREDVTWQDFFNTLPSPMKISKDCLTTGTGRVFCTNEESFLKFFLNGARDDDLLSKEIKNGDKALITYGSESEEQVQMQLNFLE